MDKMPRQSNLELMRIVAMFMVVAHHYVLHSDVLHVLGLSDSACLWNRVFLEWFGAWGKAAINPFVIVSGYFMCTSQLTARRYLKMLFEVLFYSWLFYGLFLLCGRETVSGGRLQDVFMPFFKSVDMYFTPSFLWFYLGVPVYNVIIRDFNRKQLYRLTIGLLALFVVPITFFSNMAVFHHVFWYVTLYFVGACIRLYPQGWMGNQKLVILLLCGSFVLASLALVGRTVCSSALMDFLGCVFALYQSSKLLAFVFGLGMFLFFKNLKLAYHPSINKFASCMFGVLCIHFASDAMKVFCWKDVCRVPDFACSSLWVLLLHAIGCSIFIMVVCSVIDLLRQKWIEPIILRKFGK